MRNILRSTPSWRAVLFAFPLAAAAASHAADDAVVVTATRFPERSIDAPIGMTVISRERIANSTAASLPQLLAQEAGIVTRDTTGGPDWQIDLRGFGITGDQNTLVLLNGQRLNDIELATVRWSSIPMDSIERIEILRGSGAVLYGGGATGGTINVITRSAAPGARSFSAGTVNGSYGTREVRASAAVAGERLGLSLHANDYEAGNYRFNNRLVQQNIEGDLRMGLDEGHVSFKFGLENQNQRLPGARTTAQLASDPRGATTPRDFATRDGAHASLGGSYALGFGEFAVELGYRDSVRTSSQIDYSGGGFDVYLDTRSRVWSLTPRLKLPFNALGAVHSLTVGVELDDWDYDSRRATFLETLSTPSARIFATQRDQAIYAQDNVSIGEDTKLTLGMRRQRVVMAANDVVNPAAYARGGKVSNPRAHEIGLQYNLTPATLVYGKVGRSFRISTIDEGYAQFGGPAGDAIVALLEPQVSRDHELGIEYRRPGVKARASAFLNDLRNEIYFFFPTFANINLPPTRREGVELDVSAQVTPALALSANASATQARFRGGSVIGGTNVGGNDIPLVPRNTANLGFSWQFAGQTKLVGAWHFVGKQVYDNDQRNNFPSRMPDYATVDLKLVHAAGPLRLSLAVNNLMNRHYYTYAIRNGAGTSFNAYPQRERNFMLGAELRY